MTEGGVGSGITFVDQQLQVRTARKIADSCFVLMKDLEKLFHTSVSEMHTYYSNDHFCYIQENLKL